MPLKDLCKIFDKDTFVIIHIRIYDIDFTRELSFEHLAESKELSRMCVKRAEKFEGKLHFYLQEETQ